MKRENYLGKKNKYEFILYIIKIFVPLQPLNVYKSQLLLNISA